LLKAGLLHVYYLKSHIVKNKKDARLHGDTLKSHLTDNGQLYFTRALLVPFSALKRKVVLQQFLVEMLYVAFEDPVRCSAENSTMLDDGIETLADHSVLAMHPAPASE